MACGCSGNDTRCAKCRHWDRTTPTDGLCSRWSDFVRKFPGFTINIQGEYTVNNAAGTGVSLVVTPEQSRCSFFVRR